MFIFEGLKPFDVEFLTLDITGVLYGDLNLLNDILGEVLTSRIGSEPW